MIFLEKEALSFQDVLLEPQCFDGLSRSDIDISTELCGLKFLSPILGANMSAVMNVRTAIALSNLGCMPILHRQCPDDVQVIMAQECYLNLGSDCVFGGSFGIQPGWKQLCVELMKYVHVLCLDVAHADQKKVREVVIEFRKEFGDFPLIVGNYARPDGILRLLQNEVVYEVLNKTAFKIGIGGGSVCTTRIKTGSGLPTFQSLLECQELIKKNVPVQIIADGGVQNSGDLVKCLALGAKAVMIGSLISGCEEGPGNVIVVDGQKYKSYYGNASYVAKGEDEHIEGEETLVPFKGPLRRIIRSLEQGIRSGMSYCGSNTLDELCVKAIFRRITNAGWRESLPHGLSK